VLTVSVSRRKIQGFKNKNESGNQLIEFCSMLSCSVVNGLCERGFDDGFTCVSSTDSSVIDYIIMSSHLFSVELVSAFEITSRVKSSRLPLSVYARANRNASDAANRTGKSEYSQKTAKKCTRFCHCNFCQQATVEELSHAFNETKVNADSTFDR